MSLRELAAADLRAITEDTAGFGWSATVTNPAGTSATVTGLSTDIGLTIDPQTGQPVMGRRASFAVAMATLTAAGLGIPKGVAESDSKPWVVRFADIHGTAQRFKVIESMPDRALGIVVCILEAYRAS